MPRLYTRWASGQLIAYPGNTGPGAEWFVSSADGASTNSGKDWENALTTIDAAINLSAVGDTVLVAPDHAETITGGTDITLDVAGVQVVGVQRGRQMPTVTIAHTTSTIAISGAGCTLANIRILGGINAIVASITVSAADVAILDCEYRETSTFEAVDSILTTAAAERLLIDGYRHIGSSADGANAAIAIVGAVDGVVVRNCHIFGTFAVGAIDFRTVASTNAWIHDCYIYNFDDTVIGSGGVPCIMDTITASTGTMGPNLHLVLGTDEANITEAVTGATFHSIDPIYVVNAVAQKALLINTAASADA